MRLHEANLWMHRSRSNGLDQKGWGKRREYPVTYTLFW
jgi:hypothetical protein